MRKFLIMAVMCLAGIAAHAQNNTAIMTNPNGLALDTASQAAAEGAVYRAPGANKVLSIVVKTTKISGTVAGTVSWQGSNDPAGSAASFGTISTTALVDATGVTNYVYKEVDQGYLWYRALITQTGTSSLSYTDYLHFSPAK